MSAPAPFPRTPEPGASTDPRWDVALQRVLASSNWASQAPRAWPSPTASGGVPVGEPAAVGPAAIGTIVPPSPAEPSPEPHPADHRLSDAEAALMAARRNAVNALEWIDRALRDLRKAREAK